MSVAKVSSRRTVVVQLVAPELAHGPLVFPSNLGSGLGIGIHEHEKTFLGRDTPHETVKFVPEQESCRGGIYLFTISGVFVYSSV